MMIGDFEIDPDMVELYNYYQDKVRGISNLGPLMHAHMSFYYAWRFRAIRRKASGDASESQAIAEISQKFQGERALLDKEIVGLDKENDGAPCVPWTQAEARYGIFGWNYSNPELPDLDAYDKTIADAKDRQDDTQDALLRARAKRDALPDMTQFASLVAMYDEQLLSDAKAIRASYASNMSKRQDLRPHYKVLMDAYENEYIHDNGLKDEKIVAFFDNLVHDSLAGFAKDATLPSDPRVVYLGGDEKYKYALIDRRPDQKCTLRRCFSKPREQVDA
jgi:hypothetical protein